MKTLKLKIITPERLLLEKEVESITVPTEKGDITVLPNHISLVSNLMPGEIHYYENGVENFFVISGGMIEVSKNSEVRVLADTAEFGQEIDEERAERARQRAAKLMQESYKDEKSFTEASLGLQKHLARLKVVRKHKTKTHKNLESGTVPK